MDCPMKCRSLTGRYLHHLRHCLHDLMRAARDEIWCDPVSYNTSSAATHQFSDNHLLTPRQTVLNLIYGVLSKAYFLVYYMILLYLIGLTAPRFCL